MAPPFGPENTPVWSDETRSSPVYSQSPRRLVFVDPEHQTPRPDLVPGEGRGRRSVRQGAGNPEALIEIPVLEAFLHLSS